MWNRFRQCRSWSPPAWRLCRPPEKSYPSQHLVLLQRIIVGHIQRLTINLHHHLQGTALWPGDPRALLRRLVKLLLPVPVDWCQYKLMLKGMGWIDLYQLVDETDPNR